MSVGELTISATISNDEYHRLPGVSNTKLGVFINDVRQYYYQYLSGRYVEVPQDHFDFGTCVHSISLEGDESKIVVIPTEVLAKNGARIGNAWKDFEAANSGRIMLKADDYRAVMRCVEEIRNHPVAGALLAAPGYTERMFQAHVNGMLLRCKPDKICQWNGKTIVVDLKTTTDSTADKFVKSIDRFGYHRQEYFYRKVLEANGLFVDAFVFIAVGDSEPHCVDCYELDSEWLEFAASEVEPALEDLSRRMTNNDWTVASTNSVIRVSPPSYMKFKGQYAL